MPIKQLPARPSLEQYKKQAKDLAHEGRAGMPEALARLQLHHPRFQHTDEAPLQRRRVSLTDAQLVVAREHGFASWPQFSAHIHSLNLNRNVASLGDPVSAFLLAATIPRDNSHSSGTLEEADLILSRYPHVVRASIYTCAVLADEQGARAVLAQDPSSATAAGGPHGWDALTYLCFSRYLRIDRARSDAFVHTARALLAAGAPSNTGWYETIDHPHPRQIIESAIYGAAGIAHHAELTRLLLDYGADPNDEETPYHAAEGYDLDVLRVLLASGKLNRDSITTLLLRKADWHDTDGIELLLQHGADPNAMTRWGQTALHQALRRDNRLANIVLLLDHGADPLLRNTRDGSTGTAMAARRGRGDVLALFASRNFDMNFEGLDRLIAACATADDAAIHSICSTQPHLVEELRVIGGTLLVAFAANGNTEGVRRLLNLGIPSDARSPEGDMYFDIAKESTALHAAAWRGRPATVNLLLDHGAPVNALDGKGRTSLALAIRACVDSYWKDERSPKWVEPLLAAGATLDGIDIPCGYEELDALLAAYGG